MPATAVYLGWDGSAVSAELAALVGSRYELVYVRHCAFGHPVEQDLIAPQGADYLFSFGPTIVRAPLLSRIRRAAINFHTAPPRWPGRGSVSFALFHGDAEFGVTAHLMVERVDQGAILRVRRFAIGADDDVASLDARAKAEIVPLARAVLDDLDAAAGEPQPSEERWERSPTTMAEMRALMRIDDDDADHVVERKIRAFAHPSKPGPYVERAGRKFWFLGSDESSR